MQATAYYDYQTSNVDPNGRPLILRCNDPMYPGPMTKITYQFVQGGAYGQLWREWHPDDAWVSELAVTSPTTRSETRGDGPARSFTYSGGRMTSYTDFKGAPTSIAYDGNGFVSAVTDARNNTTYTAREGKIGRITRLTHPDGTFQQFSYTDQANNPYHRQTTTDERNYSTTTTRDGNNRAIRIDYPNGAYETFGYNGFGQVTAHRLTNGATEYANYDGRGLKWSATDAAGNTSYYYYDSLDRLSQITDPRSNNTWLQYNFRGQITRVTHQDGSFVQYGYDAYGNGTSLTDELNHTTIASYDDYRRVLTATNPLNQTTTFAYWPTDYNDSAARYSHTTGALRRIKSPMGKYTAFWYDENLRRNNLWQADWSADIAHIGFSYDAVGNLISEQDPRGNVTSFGYDTRNRRTSVTNALNQTTWCGYDAVRNKTSETRPDGTSRSWGYDSMNWLADAYGFAGEHTHYSRDYAGNVTQLQDAKNAVYSFGFDNLNRKTSETYPADAGGVQRQERWHYDAAGNLDSYMNPNGETKTIEYDNRNRPTRSSWSSGGAPITVTYYDGASRRVTSVQTSDTCVNFGYDDANRQISEDQLVAGNVWHTVRHDRDADGDATTTEIPGRYGLRYDYTQRTQLSHIYDWNGGAWFNYSYDPSSNITQRLGVYGGVNDGFNAASSVYAGQHPYDPLNRAVMWENTAGGNPSTDTAFARSWYSYDSIGREVATWRDEQASKGERFDYNNSDQLIHARYNADQVWSNPINEQRKVDYDVDPLNRWAVWDSNNNNGNGLSATYYDSINLSGKAVLQNDATVNFAWNAAPPAPGIPGENFSARWEGR